jgi:UDP-glucose 4-epimerase
MKDNKILVTGGAGYIGSKISYDLTDLGFELFILDNLSTGHKILINKKAKFYFGDISDFNLVNNILKKNKIQNIIHLAASLDVNESERNPCKYYLNNVEGTDILLKAACQNKLKNFIFSSTCAVYGELNRNFKVSEKDNCNPISHYGKTKLLAEFLIKKYSEQYKFCYGILRYFNVAGADEMLRTGCYNSNDQLFKNLAKIIINNTKPTINIYGNNYQTFDGTCIRDYIYVSDLSKIHIAFLKKINDTKLSKILNCGYGRGYSVLDIVKNFEKVSNKVIKINFLKKRKGDISSIINNNKLFKNFFNKKELNLSSSIEDIISSSLKWEKKIYKNL